MASASYNAEKGKDPNWQLKTGGVMTDVQSSSMSGTRTSAFGYGVFGNEKASTKLERKAFTGEHIVAQRFLQFLCFSCLSGFLGRQVPSVAVPNAIWVSRVLQRWRVKQNIQID